MGQAHKQRSAFTLGAILLFFACNGPNSAIPTTPTNPKNGTVWRISDAGTNQALFSVTYGNGQFVAVGDSGAIVASPDGITWTQKYSGTAECLMSVTYGNGQFVAVGYRMINGVVAILTSPDGTIGQQEVFQFIPLFSIPSLFSIQSPMAMTSS